MRHINFNNHFLSKLSFGTVQLGLSYGISNSLGKPTQNIANDIVSYLVKEEINCFDTAIAYGNSEEVLGIALEKEKPVHLISKVKSESFNNDLEKTIKSSLGRLKTDKLFALLLHDSELLFTWNNSYSKKVVELQELGYIEYFGVSIYTSEEFDMAIENPFIKVIQIPFNIFDQRAINDRWLRKAKESNKLIFIRSLFLQGLFFMETKQLTGNLIEAIPYLEEMHHLRKKLNLTTAEFSLAYVDNVAPHAVILFGCDTLEQAEENIKSFNILPTIDRVMLDEINLKFSNVPKHIVNPGEWRS